MRFSMRSKRAVVLGCGPAGLFAAHALIQNGWGVEIYSNRKKSHMFGAQYLHAPIPGLTPEDAEPILIDYKLKGDVEGYRSKVYGVNQVATSVELLGKQHEAWDIRAAYDRAWNLYGEQVNHAEISPEFLGIQQFPAVNPVVLQVQRFDLVVNSIPLP